MKKSTAKRFEVGKTYLIEFKPLKKYGFLKEVKVIDKCFAGLKFEKDTNGNKNSWYSWKRLRKFRFHKEITCPNQNL